MNYKDLNDYELIYQVRENDTVAYNAIIEKYSNIVDMLVKKYLENNKEIGIDYDDLYQEGMLGIIKAMNDYNSKDTLFYTYASLCAKREILKTIKCYRRQKNKSLNEAIPFSKIIYTKKGKDYTVEETIKDDKSVEEEVLYNENYNIVLNLKNNLSFIDSSILELKLNGYSNKEISSLLDMKYEIVDYHIRKIRKKVKEVLL